MREWFSAGFFKQIIKVLWPVVIAIFLAGLFDALVYTEEEYREDAKERPFIEITVEDIDIVAMEGKSMVIKKEFWPDSATERYKIPLAAVVKTVQRNESSTRGIIRGRLVGATLNENDNVREAIFGNMPNVIIHQQRDDQMLHSELLPQSSVSTIDTIPLPATVLPDSIVIHYLLLFQNEWGVLYDSYVKVNFLLGVKRIVYEQPMGFTALTQKGKHNTQLLRGAITSLDRSSWIYKRENLDFLDERFGPRKLTIWQRLLRNLKFLK